MVTGFATRLLKIRMMSKFFMRLCFLIFAVQLMVIFAYNSWLNKLWEPTKQMVYHGFAIAWELFGAWHASSGVKVLTNTIDGFFEMQQFAFTRSLWVWLLNVRLINRF